MQALQVFILTTIVSKIAADDAIPDDALVVVSQPVPLEVRALLSSFYSTPPLLNDTRLFVEYNMAADVDSELYEGKVVEFDSLGWMNGRQTIFHKIPFLISNPAMSTPHISPEWCSSREFFKLGFRAHQMHREHGLPYQVKCATCHPTIEGLNSVYYLYPERDLYHEISKLPIASRLVRNEMDYCTNQTHIHDCEAEPRAAKFHDYLRINDLHFGKWSRWSGEHATTEEGRTILGTPDGELAIFDKEVEEGFTTMCGVELNGEILSSNVFVSSDVIKPESTTSDSKFSYDSYETLETVESSFKDETINLEMFVSWDAWGCCSACCCPSAICGHDLETASSCENVFSARTRVGHLSIRILRPNDRIKLNSFTDQLHQLLSHDAYLKRGVPLHSSLLQRVGIAHTLPEIKETLIPNFLSANQVKSYEFKSGMFVEKASCKDDPQKTDCTKWAHCHNIPVEDIRLDDWETKIDSCNQVHFVDVLVGIEPMRVKVSEGQNLRIRIDPEVHDTNRTKAKWRVNLRKPKKYEKNKPCILQGTVLRNDEILILGFSNFALKIDLILNDKQKVRVVFASNRKAEDAKIVKYTVLYWAIAIIAFFLLLICGVVMMHREKTKRMERKINERELHT